MSQQWVLASGNKGKIKEFSTLLESLNIEVLPQNQWDFAEAIEDGLSFIENAIIKARHAAKHTGLPALADDSGIAVDALGGKPGIYSARYANLEKGIALEELTDSINVDCLLANMDGQNNRAAQFHCVIAFVRNELDPTPIIAVGKWQGELLSQRQGEGGFGYDPIFYVPEFDCSAAQLTKEQKNSLSHRGQAIKQLLPQLKSMFNV